MKKLLFAVAALMVVTGCIKEDVDLTLNADGSGKIVIKQKFVGKFGAAMAEQFKAEFDGASEEEREKGRIAVLKQLSEGYQGIDCWSNPSFVCGEKSMTVGATGYFSKLTEIKMVSEDRRTKETRELKVISLTKLENGNQLFAISKSDKDGMSDNFAPPPEDASDEDKAAAEQRQQLMMGMMEGMFEGFEMNTNVMVPGEVVKTHNMDKKDNKFVFSLNLDKLKKTVTGAKEDKTVSIEYKSGATAERNEEFNKEMEAAKKYWVEAQKKIAELKAEEEAKREEAKKAK